jgi:hypothetical protein
MPLVFALAPLVAARLERCRLPSLAIVPAMHNRYWRTACKCARLAGMTRPGDGRAPGEARDHEVKLKTG